MCKGLAVSYHNTNHSVKRTPKKISFTCKPAYNFIWPIGTASLIDLITSLLQISSIVVSTTYEPYELPHLYFLKVVTVYYKKKNHCTVKKNY